MASASIAATDSFPLIRLPRIHCRPLLSSLVFFASDTIAITITGTLVLWGSQGSGWGWISIGISPFGPLLFFFSRYLLTPTSIPASSTTQSPNFAGWLLD